LTKFRGVNSIGLEKLYEKSVDKKSPAIAGQISYHSVHSRHIMSWTLNGRTVSKLEQAIGLS